MDILSDKCYVVDVDANVIVAGPFETDDAGDNFMMERGVNMLFNSNPFAVWSGASILEYGKYAIGSLDDYDLTEYEDDTPYGT